jgi:TetR/AcrR family transcriptional regulator, transcriptional repressor for nem operon
MAAALDRAVRVFRERGYHAASLADLSSAMRLTTGSIYKAFRDKREIFLAALEHYTSERNTELRNVLDAESNGFNRVRALLRFYAESSHDSEGRCGCLVMHSAAELATFDAEMADRVRSALRRLETLLRELIRLGQSDGSLSADLDVNACATALLSVLQGFRVVGKTGRTRAEMMSAANQALRILS